MVVYQTNVNNYLFRAIVATHLGQPFAVFLLADV